MLVASLLMALLPLLAVVWIILYGAPFTVDGLFTALIFLTLSGVMGINVLLELKKAGQQTADGPSFGGGGGGGGTVQKGKVKSVEFYESNVGQPNKSIVTLSQGAKADSMLVFDGDLRNALPVGQKVAIRLRKESGYNVLENVSYS